MSLRNSAVTIAVTLTCVAGAHAQQPAAPPKPPATPVITSPDSQESDDGQIDERPKKRGYRDDLTGWQYASKGLQYRSSNGRWFQWFTFRNQFRVSTPFDDTPESPDDLPAKGAGETEWSVNRSRIKLGGSLGTDRIQDFFEYDLKNKRPYHFFTTIQFTDWLGVRAGQWKVEFNRERVDSSGDQEFVDRSIVNEDFTLDAQFGAQLFGRLFKGRPADGNYYLGVYAGEGRLARNDDGVPMVLARYQWNVFRRTVGFSQSDVEYHPSAAATIGVAYAQGRGRYTRFSSSGGAQLEGFETTVAGRYDLRQWMTDFAFFRRGLSSQGELHWKHVFDRIELVERDLQGGYVQVGYFPVREWSRVLSALEVAGRIGYVDPDTSLSSDFRTEFTGGINWYFNQHRNKISFDVGRLAVGGTSSPRVRLQWDFSM